jgi:CSLREA domain-containing protein
MTRNWFSRRNVRLHLEHLEDRSVPSTFTVNTTLDDVTPANGKFSLREAITKANTTAGSDTILLPAGVFKIILVGAGDDANLSGDFDITDTLTIQGAGAGITIIDGQQLDRVFDVTGTAPSSIKVVLQGLTVRNGSVVGDGGGVRVANADLVVRDCALTGNRASLSGGGISNPDAPGTGNVTLVRTTVARNAAGTNGGGLALLGAGSALAVNSSMVRRNTATNFAGGMSADTVNLTNSTVSGNVAGSNGGGIIANTATVTNSTISGNHAASFGGGGLSADTVNLTNSTVSGNTAGGGGGGINATTATVTNSTISGNTAGGGGGGINATTATVTNSTVSGNTTASFGGGIIATTATLINCTIAENIGHTGGGLFHSPGGTFSVRNTIIALNLVDFTGTNPDVSGAFTSGGHNLIGNGTGGTGFTNGVNGDQFGTSVNPLDPKLGPLQNNGGPTKTMALLVGSPAVDHGDNAGAPPNDQRGAGFARKKDGNGDGIAVVDIGAFER